VGSSALRTRARRCARTTGWSGRTPGLDSGRFRAVPSCARQAETVAATGGRRQPSYPSTRREGDILWQRHSRLSFDTCRRRARPHRARHLFGCGRRRTVGCHFPRPCQLTPDDRLRCNSPRLRAKDRDRGKPRGSAPPTPPGTRVRTTAVREVGSSPPQPRMEVRAIGSAHWKAQ
jgi:hypothetical protein